MTKPLPVPTVTLREHLDALRDVDHRHAREIREADQAAVRTALASSDKAIATALQVAGKAADKAVEANDKRFEGVDEFRDAVQKAMAELTEKIGILTDSMNRISGQSKGTSQGWAYLIAGAGVAVAVASLVFVVLNR